MLLKLQMSCRCYSHCTAGIFLFAHKHISECSEVVLYYIIAIV